MKYFEVHVPYQALLKARNEIDATNKYIEIVEGNDEEFEQIRESMEVVEKAK